VILIISREPREAAKSRPRAGGRAGGGTSESSGFSECVGTHSNRFVASFRVRRHAAD
jgi:hypothetical protein